MRLQFELATQDQDGNQVSPVGLDIVQDANEEFPELTDQLFVELEKEHLWDPDIYINIWLTDFLGDAYFFSSSSGTSYWIGQFTYYEN